MSQKSVNTLSDNKMKQKERQKVKNIKKKQAIPRRVEKAEIKRTQKVSEKYLKEELQVEKSLKEHLQNQPIDDEYEKQRQAEIDFFCDPYSTVPLIIEKIKSTDNDSEKEEEEEDEAHSTHSNESSPNTHMASTYIGHEHESVVAKFELTRISFNEMKLLFYPKSEPRGEFLIILQKICNLLFLTKAPLSNDEERIMQRKSNDNDGIYIHDAPSLRKISNKLLLLDRLHESGTTELLDANGDLKNFEKLIDDDVYRLHCERKFTPIYVPPIPMNFEPLDKIISEKKFLKILVGNLKFDQHKLFSNEHYAARMVEKLYAEYERRQKLNIVETLRKKLNNLRELKEESGGKDISLLQQIKNVRQKLHVEEQYDHKIVKSLLDNWKSLKTIRKQQNSAMTNISLKIQKNDSSDIVQRQGERQQEYDAELNEMIAEEFEKYHMAKQKYKEFLKNTNDPDKITHEHEEVVKKPKRPDIDKIVMELNGIYDKIPIHEPELRVILHNNESDATAKPKEKLKKFNRISYRIELEVDGEVVGSTKHCRLDEDFFILIQSAFILKLTKHLPEKIKLMVNRKLFTFSTFHISSQCFQSVSPQ
jgi:coiled-coil and C2 domain-containing protein 2A